MLKLLKVDRRRVNIQKIAGEIYNNVLRAYENGEYLIEYSWYAAGSTEISPLKEGIDCSVLKTMPADFCVENTQTIIDTIQQMVPNSLIGLDIQDISTLDAATTALAADLRALNNGGGLLERMAHIQYNRRQAQTKTYEAVLTRSLYPYIVVDWSEEDMEEES